MKNYNKKYLAYSLYLVPLVALLACNDIEQPSLVGQLLAGSHNRIGIVNSDLSSSGRFSLLTPDGLPQLGQASIHSDARARFFQDRVYIINRLGRDNIQVLNPELLYLSEREFSVGLGSNPHDIAVATPDRAYISLYERNFIQLANPLAAALGGSISLALYADADGVPEMSGMHLEGNLLYVAVQRLDRNAAVGVLPPADYSLLVEIDTATNTVVATYPTPFPNPLGKPRRLQLFGQPHLVWPMPAYLGVQTRLDGGVVAFNLATRTFRAGALYSEITAGDDILDVAIKNDTQGYAVVLYADNSSALHRFDPSTGTTGGILQFLPSTGGYVGGLLLGPNGYLYVAESGLSDPGIVIYDTNAGDLRLTPLAVSIGLRPTDLIYIP